MAKSTQDVSVWLRHLANELGISDGLLSLEQFSDKSFRVNKHTPAGVVTIYDSDDQPENLDINDVAYYTPEQFVKLCIVIS